MKLERYSELKSGTKVDCRDMWGLCHSCKSLLPMDEIGFQQVGKTEEGEPIIRKQPNCGECRAGTERRVVQQEKMAAQRAKQAILVVDTE